MMLRGSARLSSISMERIKEDGEWRYFSLRTSNA